MRKRNLKCIADTVFWYLLYLLPVVCYLLYLVAEPGSGNISISDISEFFTKLGLGFVADNIVITSLTALFGVGGILPLFSTSAPFLIFSWFICVFIGHLAVDFILFIPRLAHKWLEHFTQGD